MCTFTAIATDQAPDRKDHDKKKIRICFNRDELRSRPPGENPEIFVLHDIQYIMPVDTQSGGTWIAINDAGIFFALLNVNPGLQGEDDEFTKSGNTEKTFLSRGTIIPSLIGLRNIADVKNKLKDIDVDRYPGFRLVFIDTHGMNTGYLRHDGINSELNCRRWNGQPVFYTSSGLGDEYVYDNRIKLFHKMFDGFDGNPLYEKKQDEFHSHQWKDKKDVSVNMERKNASTVSRSVIEIIDSHIKFIHYMPPFAPVPAVMEIETIRPSGITDSTSC